jgi:uncharacterized protein (DUF885 family)
VLRPVFGADAELPDGPGTDALRERAATIYSEHVRPALTRLAVFVGDEYVPAARATDALTALPGGDAWYEHLVRAHTSTREPAGAIHELGTALVDELDAAMSAIAGRLVDDGPGGFERFLTAPAQRFGSAAEILAHCTELCATVDNRLDSIVTRRPALPFRVEAMPPHLALSGPAAYYWPGSHEAGRPGTYLVNVLEPQTRPRWTALPLALHECIPGHHLQIALAAEHDELPRFRRHGRTNAYIEGWALYAESLAVDLGLVESELDEYGLLAYRMWRACRLVVDTGIHAFGWNRARAIAFMHERARLPLNEVEAEVDRYIAWPGQALGYEMGAQVLRARRAAYAAAHGEAALPRFHDDFLALGPVPLVALPD